MANLSKAELVKRPWRSSLIAKKIKEESPFEVVPYGHVVFQKDPELIKLFENFNISYDYNKVLFKDKNGKGYKLSDIKKTKEFGGGSNPLYRETRELEQLKKLIDDVKTKERNNVINVKFKNSVVSVFDVEKSEKIGGIDPKSDFHFVDINGKSVLWISHKDGRTPKDFQEWGGMSERNEYKIYSLKETQDFIESVRSKYTEIPPATVIARRIKNLNGFRLKEMAVYGSDFGGNYGFNNVTHVLQGTIRFESIGNMLYEISASGHSLENGEPITGDYEPVFMALHRKDRNSFGIRYSRFGIYPIGNRKITEWI